MKRPESAQVIYLKKPQLRKKTTGGRSRICTQKIEHASYTPPHLCFATRIDLLREAEVFSGLTETDAFVTPTDASVLDADVVDKVVVLAARLPLRRSSSLPPGPLLQLLLALREEASSSSELLAC